MSELLPLALCWLCAPVFLLLDGCKPAVAWVAAALLAIVTVADLVLLAAMVWLEQPPLSVVTGGWPAGPGIRLYVDPVSLFFGAVCGLVLTAVLVHEARARVRSRSFPALILFMCAGLHGAFATGDLFNFYVFFEISVVTSFALAAYGFGREEVRGAFIYIIANLLGSSLFLIGIAVVYHTAGTLDLIKLAERAEEGGHGIHLLGAALLFAAFSLKLGLFPLHGWVPVIYSHAQPAVAAVMSGALINIGAYGMLRIGLLAAEGARAEAAPLLLGLGAVAIVYGALLAARRETPSEIIAYASIAQAGYIVLAFGAGGRTGAAAALLVVLAGSLEKAAMFLSQEGSGRLRSATAFAAAAGVAGLPLTLGLLAKIELFRATVLAPAGLLLAAVLAIGTCFLFVAAVRFWDQVRRLPVPEAGNVPASAVLAAATVVLALFAAPLDGLMVTLSSELYIGGGQ
ncbi:MAG: complex I subunit 5 family protein [Alphaproteobacteria bacterium]